MGLNFRGGADFTHGAVGHVTTLTAAKGKNDPIGSFETWIIRKTRVNLTAAQFPPYFTPITPFAFQLKHQNLIYMPYAR